MRVKLLDLRAQVPIRRHPGDAGLDLVVVEGAIIEAGQRARIPTGIALAIDYGWEGQIRARSSSFWNGLIIDGTIDATYRGEVQIQVWNINRNGFVEVKSGDRIAQLIIAPVYTCDLWLVDDLEETPRGSGGFGSTGR